MTALPDTNPKGVSRGWPAYAIVGAAPLALALGVEAFSREEDFSPEEKSSSLGIRDIAVNAEDNLYPQPDRRHLEGLPETVFVCLSVEGLHTR
jgi:hypothetical protein